jgi:hypothetical protein
MSCIRSSPLGEEHRLSQCRVGGLPAARKPTACGIPRATPRPRREIPHTVDRCVDRPVEKAVYAGDNTGCPVDGQRILRLVPASPCAGPSPGSRKALTTSGASPTGGDPGQSGGSSRTCGEPGNRSSARVSGTRWRSAADSSRATGQPSNRHAGLRAERGPSISYMEGPPSLLCRPQLGHAREARLRQFRRLTCRATAAGPQHGPARLRHGHARLLAL